MEQRFALIAILFLISLAMGCSVGPKHPLTWHTMLEIDAAVPNREAAVKRTIAVVESRLDALGVSSFKVRAQGTPTEGQILVSLSDVADRERLKKIITSGGRLELTAVISPPIPSPVQIYDTQQDAAASLGGTVPANRRVLPYFEQHESIGGEKPQKWVVVESPAVVEGSELRNAAAVRTAAEDYYISFSLKPTGAEKLGSWTAVNINSYLAVILNDEVKSIAFIKSQIFDQGEINGRFTKQAAEDLALTLNSGALPAPVKIINEGVNK